MPTARKKAARRGESRAKGVPVADPTVIITHPEKVLFPDDGITKRDLANYYEVIAPYMLPLIVGRPVTLERFLQGIGG